MKVLVLTGSPHKNGTSNTFDENVLREEFDIPNEYTPVCLLPLGYKAEDCPLNPLHDKRKSIEELVEYK